MSPSTLFPLQPGGTNEGRLWVMPAGKLMPAWHESWEGPSPYWQALAEIDWQAFYDRQDGYLVFEDMRQQWQQLEPDYVLIDTHSGVTAYLGIATRQLPDAVVLLFNPHLGGKDGMTRLAGKFARHKNRPADRDRTVLCSHRSDGSR